MTAPAREYGEGLYTLARDEGLSEQLLNELGQVSACFHEHPEYVHLLGNLSIPKSERVGILDTAFRASLHPYLLNFLKILCERGFISEFEESVKAYRECFRRDNDIIQAVATTAKPLTSQQRASLAASLEASTHKKVLLSEKIDPSIIDGMLLEMDGKRIDGTLRRRLNDIQSLIANEA